MHINMRQWIIFFMIVIAVSIIFAMGNSITTESLSMDECFLARNIDKSPEGLFISSATSAPGFYFTVYMLVQIFGKQEWVYRIIPLLAAAAGLILFMIYLLKKYIISVGLTAFLLMAFSFPFVEFAGYAHPYTLDVLFTLLLIIYSEKILGSANLKEWIPWFFITIIAVSSSYPAVYTVFGCTLVILINFFIQKKYTLLIKFGIGSVVLGIYTLCLIIFIYIKQASSVMNVDSYYWTAFYPDSLNPLSLFQWAINSTSNLLGYLFWNTPSFCVAGIFLIGLGIIQNVEKKSFLRGLLLIMPILVTMAAAALQKWPYGGIRTMLFALPLFTILIADTLSYVLASAHLKSTKILIFVLCFLLVFTQSWVIKRVFQPNRESQRPTRMLRKEMLPLIEDEDTFLLYYSSEVHFRFYFPDYLDRSIIEPWSHSANPDSLRHFVISNMKSQKGRVWLIYTKSTDEERRIQVKAARSVCSAIDSVKVELSSAYLFDCNSSNETDHETK